MKKKILITGCAGFIGSNLVNFLLKKNVQIIGIDNLSTGNIRLLKNALKNKKFKFYKKDLFKNKISQYFKDVSIVYHFAANADVRFGLKHTKKDINELINALAVIYNLKSRKESYSSLPQSQEKISAYG